MKMQSRKIALDKIYRRRDRYEIPDWQRQEVWGTSKKQNLIDSILRGWKLPSEHPRCAKARSAGTEMAALETLRMLEALNMMRHNHFGHGMSEPFSLSAQEVDFVYLSCMAAAILFARMWHHNSAT